MHNHARHIFASLYKYGVVTPTGKFVAVNGGCRKESNTASAELEARIAWCSVMHCRCPSGRHDDIQQLQSRRAWPAAGDIDLVAVPQQLTALRAKVISRLMEPWKAYFHRSREWLERSIISRPGARVR